MRSSRSDSSKINIGGSQGFAELSVAGVRASSIGASAALLQLFRTAIQIRQSRSAADAGEIACSITVALSCRGCVFYQTWS